MPPIAITDSARSDLGPLSQPGVAAVPGELRTAVPFRDQSLVQEPTLARVPAPADAGRGRDVPASPDRGELAVWRAYLRGHATVTRALEADLLAEQRLSLAAYDVLVQLAEAPGQRLRMTELADAVLLSRSGVTRLVDRLERAGLVARCRVREDGRGVAAALTDRGLERMRRASGTHLDGVARHFTDRLGETDLANLRQISQRLSE
jgi:DNA-binding MarR family transcriptional regulator